VYSLDIDHYNKEYRQLVDPENLKANFRLPITGLVVSMANSYLCYSLRMPYWKIGVLSGLIIAMDMSSHFVNLDNHVSYVNFLRWNIEMRKMRARLEYDGPIIRERYNNQFNSFHHYILAFRPPQDLKDELVELIWDHDKIKSNNNK